MRDILNTKRLVLRQLELGDAPAISRLAGEYDIACMTGSFPHPFPLLSAEFKVMDLQQKKRRSLAYPYAITFDGGELMGMVDLFRRETDAALEIGYWLGKPYWRQGYITEAANAIIAESHKTLGADSLIAGVFSDNLASLRVLQKLGFELTGRAEMYFSMSRLEKVHSLDLRLNISSYQRSRHLRSHLKVVMRA